MNHLADLWTSAALWYNEHRPHQRIAGNRPGDVHRTGCVTAFAPTDRAKCKSVPPDIERTRFDEPRTTAWRLKRCA